MKRKKTALVKVGIQVDPALWKKVRIRAINEGIQVQELIWRTIEAYLKGGTAA